ncbi:unnamed protein product [Acanthoscelides obtectus]|uniref:Uncharacterized protein n=1 Tax=Acanthoscelides obtectus TaxID=200917 RepID=A0A9P0PT51_ACAOB|nr:unnamed protein product [Acanthoscelides obtectus]CAK1624104.1 hypothetical protein AOBTE_LOCUS2327 [Acanthoscelides obtectus]
MQQTKTTHKIEVNFYGDRSHGTTVHETESVDNALPTEETGEADDVVEMRTAVVEEVSRKSQQPITSRPGCNKKQKKNEDLTTETLMTVRDHFKTPKEQLDRFDLLGKTIAVKLRGLEKRQALIAEKKIGDILFEAEMGSLNTAPIYRYAASPSQSPYTTPCPTPSPTYGQGSCTALASQSPNVTPCPTPSPTYGQGSFRQFHNDGSGQLSFSQDNTASTYFSQFDANS